MKSIFSYPGRGNPKFIYLIKKNIFHRKTEKKIAFSISDKVTPRSINSLSW